MSGHTRHLSKSSSRDACHLGHTHVAATALSLGHAMVATLLLLIADLLLLLALMLMPMLLLLQAVEEQWLQQVRFHQLFLQLTELRLRLLGCCLEAMEDQRRRLLLQLLGLPLPPPNFRRRRKHPTR